jgi:hypothetical protein
VAKGTAMSPYASYDAKSGNVYLNDYLTAVWNTSATWSNAAVWGSSQFVTGAPASTVAGSNVLWGATCCGAAAAHRRVPMCYGARTFCGEAMSYGAVMCCGEAMCSGDRTPQRVSSKKIRTSV